MAGQNIANAATEGYTRQRVEQSSMAAPAQGLFGTGASRSRAKACPWTRIARLGNSFLDCERPLRGRPGRLRQRPVLGPAGNRRCPQ